MSAAPLRYLELFAGAGGLSMGLEQAGWFPVAHAEVAPHARAVLRRWWPHTPLHGDVTGVDWRPYAGAVELVAGGSPCQDLSVAGKRAGLAGARSGLFYELVRAWEHTAAPYCLWENVSGALTSNDGRDFAAVLGAFVGATVAVPAGGWRSGGVAAGRAAVAAWRVLDLRWFGPAQRRSRVFVVAVRRALAGRVDPGECLALGACSEGHPAPRRAARGADSSGSSGRARGDEHDVAPCLNMGAHIAAPGYNGQDALQWASLMVPRYGRARKLLPIEGERLMGWPDDWTVRGVGEDGHEYALSDTARYQLIGNGVGAPVAAWIGARLAAAHRAADVAVAG